MTPEDKIIDSIIDVGNRIVDAIDQTTEAMSCFPFAQLLQTTAIILALLCFGCPRSKAAPLHNAAPEPPALQYWHTVDIPTDSGVYPLEVFAPALPPLFAQPQIVEIGTPPEPPVHVPEPGTWALVGAVLVGLLREQGWSE